ncbi:hypothetical protein L208DRAFT_1103111, partial [Tricholoma matsutake]
MPSVICTCTVCSMKTVCIHGVEQPGQSVSGPTRLMHEKQDKNPALARWKPQSSPSSSSKKSTASNSPTGNTDINFSTTLIIKMVCLLVIWLHTRAGVSRAVTNKVLRAIQVIISATLYLVGIALMSSGFAIKLSNISSRQHAVPSAFPSSLIQFLGNVSGRSLQDHMHAIQISGKFRIPGMAPNGFHASCTIIEDSLHKTYHDHINHPPAVFGATINDIQGSPAWNDILGFLQSPYHLLFGIYVDWYNPHTNKIAGRSLERNYIQI